MPGYLFSRIMLIPAVLFFAVGPSRAASQQIEVVSAPESPVSIRTAETLTIEQGTLVIYEIEPVPAAHTVVGAFFDADGPYRGFEVWSSACAEERGRGLFAHLVSLPLKPGSRIMLALQEIEGKKGEEWTWEPKQLADRLFTSQQVDTQFGGGTFTMTIHGPEAADREASCLPPCDPTAFCSGWGEWCRYNCTRGVKEFNCKISCSDCQANCACY
ncbi:MAG TPA: hypothetical protein P5300_12390 [Acidobacteriota bacterium]|nr:hypothetical protein [Acidobacteriota bacterium]